MGLLDRIFGRWSNRHYQDGMRHFNRGDYAAAVEAFDLLAQEIKGGDSPQVELARFYAAEAHAKMGLACFYNDDLSRARKEFESAVEVEEEYPDLHFHLGVIAERERRFEDALRHLDQALSLHSEYLEALGYRALVRMEKGDAAQAAQDLAALKELGFEIPESLRGGGPFKDEAVSDLRDLLTHHIEGKRHAKQAVTLAGRGDLNAAAKELEQAIQENPTYPDLRHRYGLVLADLGRHDQALGSYAKALELHPAYLDAQVARGVSLMALERWGEALDGLRKAAELGDSYADVHLLLGRASAKAGDTEQAVRSLERAVRLNPRYMQAWEELGGVLESRGDAQGALAARRRAREK